MVIILGLLSTLIHQRVFGLKQFRVIYFHGCRMHIELVYKLILTTIKKFGDPCTGQWLKLKIFRTTYFSHLPDAYKFDAQKTLNSYILNLRTGPLNHWSACFHTSVISIIISLNHGLSSAYTLTKPRTWQISATPWLSKISYCLFINMIILQI